jgi:NAD(P)-dependent dehydrogenase (short-subunit alcohol dehydrogenase family)
MGGPKVSYEIDEEAVAAALAKIKVSTGGALPEPPPMGTTMLPKGTFEGRVVAITGGGGGLGRGFAAEFARLGATVAILSRTEKTQARGIAAVEAVGGKAVAATVDVRDPGQVAAAFDAVEKAAGPVDVFLNNAAGNIPGPAEDLSPRAFKAVTGIVLEGAFFCAREFTRRALLAKRPGAILNIGAHTVWTGGAGQALSAAAKAGVHSLTLSLAVEWAPYGIRINTLVPGMFPQDDLKIDVIESIVAKAGVPGGRFGRLQELCWAAAYLCSPFANYITGAVLVVDGANWQQRGPMVGGTFTPVREQMGFPPFGESYDPVAIAKKNL